MNHPTHHLTSSPSHPLFPGTDVPLACLFIHLQQGYTIPQFLQDFPAVSKEQVQDLLEWTGTAFKTPNLLAELIIGTADTEEE
ncbi:MAG: DUF433 domain-containing protein [Lewinella sp.]|nr:DUF433 domain-containing protein [Lewinella sp.]